MKGLLAASLLALALAPIGAAHAQLFKCVTAGGHTSYQSEPCPTTAGSQERLSVQPSPTAAAPALMAGWNNKEVRLMADLCETANFREGQRDFDAHRQPAHTIFEGTAIAPSVTSHCWCLADRASKLWPFAEFSRNPQAFTSKLTDEAMAGGPCAPFGKHAELLRKIGRMK